MVAPVPLQLGSFYHIYLGASNATVLFKKDADYMRFLTLYRRFIEPVAETFAYCLLSNHFHFFVRTRTLREQVEAWWGLDSAETASHPSATTIADFNPLNPDRQFAQLLAAYSSSTHHQTALTTTPIQRILLSNDALYPPLIRYIHQNPKLHQQTGNFRSYRWSSYRALLSRQPTRLAVDQVMRWFHGEEWFDEMHWVPVDETKIGYLILED